MLTGWKLHPFFCKHYGCGDSGTMWRCEGNGHKYRTNRFWQGLRDYLLWGFPVVCAFLNMKLSNPNDRRPIWKYKHSLVSYTMEHAPHLGFRQRNPVSIEESNIGRNRRRVREEENSPRRRNRRRVQRNRYKCVLGARKSKVAKLRAAEYCERTTGRRMVSIAEYFNVRGKQLACARCNKDTAYACVACGVALCIKTVSSSANHLPVSCMDICHLRWKYDINTGRVLR